MPIPPRRPPQRAPQRAPQMGYRPGADINRTPQVATANAQRLNQMKDEAARNNAVETAMKMRAQPEFSGASAMNTVAPQVPAPGKYASPPAPTSMPTNVTPDYTNPVPSGGGFGSVGMKKGGRVSGASRRGDGLAQRGKTKGRMV